MKLIRGPVVPVFPIKEPKVRVKAGAWKPKPQGQGSTPQQGIRDITEKYRPIMAELDKKFREAGERPSL